MMRTRVSHLEAFRRLRGEFAEPGDEVRLIMAVAGHADKPSWQMRAGTEWHLWLEGEEPEKPEFHFDPDAISMARQKVGPGLCEVTGRRIFDLGETPIEVKGTADWLLVPMIQDHKTCFATPDTSWYEQSLQWRFYLEVHRCDCFQYNLWHFKEPDTNGHCEFKDVLTFRCYRYPRLHEECRDWLRAFLGWAQERQLTKALETIIP